MRVSTLGTMPAAILLACGLIGRPAPASAAPSDDPGPYQVKREFGLRAAMADGVTLVADVYRPVTPNRVPALLVRTPYLRAGLGSYREGHYWASHGYAYVVQDVRGRGDSEGRFEPLVNEGRDGYQTQSWIARQPWSDGQVGTLGGSYSGWTQVFPAVLNNPAHKAMIPTVTPSDPGGFWPQRRGGISFGMLEWAMVVGGRIVRSFPDEVAELLAAYRSLPLRTIDERIGARSAIWRNYLANLENPAYWKARSYQDRLPQSRVPMFHVTGWYDGTLGGSLENFAAMRAKAAPAARANQYLLVGPWRHWVDSDATGTVIGGFDFGPGAVVDTRRQYRRWFDRHLKQDATAVADWPRVRLFVLGDNRWIGTDDWPLPGTRFTPVYLHGARAGEPAAGRMTTDSLAVEAGTDRYDYDPADPTPFFWTRNVDSGGPDDYRAVEARRDVLVYTMESPSEKLTVCGPIRATIVATSSALDTDWVARLTLVRADGYSQRLTEGWVRARARRGEFRNDPLTPGRAERYEIDLWGTCVAVKPGERLRLSVMSGAFPLLTRNLNTGGDLALETKGVVARQAVHHQPGQLSFVTLPFASGVREIATP